MYWLSAQIYLGLRGSIYNILDWLYSTPRGLLKVTFLDLPHRLTPAGPSEKSKDHPCCCVRLFMRMCKKTDLRSAVTCNLEDRPLRVTLQLVPWNCQHKWPPKPSLRCPSDHRLNLNLSTHVFVRTSGERGLITRGGEDGKMMYFNQENVQHIHTVTSLLAFLFLRGGCWEDDTKLLTKAHHRRNSDNGYKLKEWRLWLSKME